MKKTLCLALGLILGIGVLTAPILTQAVTSTSSIENLMTSLQEQINNLRTQLEQLVTQFNTLKQLQQQVKESSQEVKGTIQLLSQLRPGMTNEEVKKLQEILATDPDIYPEGLITGYYGPLTEQAVRRLQKKLCLDPVGSVGPQTLRRINELLQEGAGSSGNIPPGLLRAPGIQKNFVSLPLQLPLPQFRPLLPQLLQPLILLVAQLRIQHLLPPCKTINLKTEILSSKED